MDKIKKISADHQIIRVGVGTLIFNQQRQILLGLRKSPHGNGSWCPPGGHLEYGESFEKAAIRETREETGLQIFEKTIAIAGITNDFFTESGKHYITVMLKTDVFSGQPEVLEPEKCEKWQWFDLFSLPKNLFLPVQNFFKKHPPESLI